MRLQIQRPVFGAVTAGFLLMLTGCAGADPLVETATVLPPPLVARPALAVPVTELPAGFVYRSETGAKRFMVAPGPVLAGEAPRTAAVFMPLGMNYAWPALANLALDMELTLPLLAQNGVNLLRVWHCTWGIDLGGWNADGVLDGPGVAALDRLMAAAEKRGVKILLVYDNHTDVLSNQARHGLFMQGAGGAAPVCATIADYFQAPAARAIHAARLKAMMARWGSSPAFFGVEMFNELDLALPIDAATPAGVQNRALLADWAHSMAQVVWTERAKQNIAAWHPIGVSTAWPGTLRCAYDPYFDFVPVHQYLPEAAHLRYDREMNETQLVAETCLFFNAAHPVRAGAIAHRPWLMEYGFAAGGSTSPRNKLDPAGAHLRHGLWASMAAGGEGCAMPWWWDSYLLPARLTALYRPLADTVAGLPWDQPERAYVARGAEERLPGSAPSAEACRMYGTLWSDTAFLYLVRDTASWAVQTRDSAQAGPVAVQNRPFAMEAGPFAPGRYAVEWTDPASGRPAAANEVVVHPGGPLKLTTPAFSDDLAMVLHRVLGE